MCYMRCSGLVSPVSVKYVVLPEGSMSLQQYCPRVCLSVYQSFCLPYITTAIILQEEYNTNQSPTVYEALHSVISRCITILYCRNWSMFQLWLFRLRLGTRRRYYWSRRLRDSFIFLFFGRIISYFLFLIAIFLLFLFFFDDRLRFACYRFRLPSWSSCWTCAWSWGTTFITIYWRCFRYRPRSTSSANTWSNFSSPLDILWMGLREYPSHGSLTVFSCY